MPADLRGQSWAVLAASEMGKGVFLKGWLRKSKPARLLVWDRNDEYGEFAQQLGTLAELAQACRGSGFAVRYVPRGATPATLRAEFEAFCMIALRLQRACVLVEELADVTTASHAPPAWGQVNTRGRHHQGLHIIGVSQSPAWIDKRFLANATLLHVGYLGTVAHRKAVADEIDVSPDDIKAMGPGEYMQYRRATKELKRGRVDIPTHTPARKPRARA